MKNSFEILAGFLERFDNEVEGRESPEPPPPEVETKIHELARGQLSQTEGTEFLALLKQNPAWIPRLAAEIKSLRASQGSR
jgi:hypothetical protein